MTRSLTRIADCVRLEGPVSVKDDLLPRVERGIAFPAHVPGIPGLPLTDRVSLLQVMRHAEWWWCPGQRCYRKMPVPADLRAPAREEAQILVDGIATSIELFMGDRDWELDWHIYLDLEETVKTNLRAVGPLHDSRDTLYCEWMVVSRWEDETVGRQWWSSNMDGVLSLRWPLPNGREGAANASEHWSLVEDDHQGDSSEVVAALNNPARRGNSAIIGARVYLQGAFVNDRGHNYLEIHPLDSVAYARDASGNPLSARPTESAWPDTTVRWRVAAVTNAGFHRINQADFVRKERTTTWYLALPTAASFPGFSIDVTQSAAGLPDRRVRSVTADPPADGALRSYGAFPTDPTDGRRKLKITLVMDEPDDRGGHVLRDYRIRARQLLSDG